MFVPLGFANALMMPIYLVYLQDLFTPDVRWLSWAFLPAGLVFAILPPRARPGIICGCNFVFNLACIRPFLVGCGGLHLELCRLGGD